MRILRDVSHARHHAITTELRIRKRMFIEHFDRVRVPGSERGVRVAVSICGSYEHHFLTRDELPHLGIEVVEHSMLIEGEGLEALAVLFLKLMLSGRSGQDFRL